MWLEIELTSYEFEGVSGEVRTFPGCSLVGLFQFNEVLSDLQAMLVTAHPEMPAAVLYECDKRFRFLVDKALKLNGINPDWVNWTIAEQMLFSPGILLELNKPKKSKTPSDGKVTSLAEMVAALSTVTGLTDAIALAKSEPFQPLLDILEAMQEQAKTPEERQKTDFKAWVQAEKSKSSGMIDEQ